MAGARIECAGVYRPENTVTAAHFRVNGENDAGVPLERRHAAERETSVFMGTQAAKAALARGGLGIDDVDLLLYFSGMPDYEVPGDGNLILKELGSSRGAAWKVDTACASFISQLQCAHTLIASGVYHRIMLLNVMTWVNRGIDQKRTNFATLGDGAAAVVVSAADTPSLLSCEERAEPEYFDFIRLRSPFATKSEEHFHFDAGPAHARFFLGKALGPAKSVLEKSGDSTQTVQWFLPHQTGTQMMDRWTRSLGFEAGRRLDTFQEAGNMSAVNIPHTLHKFIYEEPRIARGDRLLFFAVGAGLHVAAMVWQY